MFNSKRQLLVDFLAQEYSIESAEEQIANCNLVFIGGNKYSVQYDNGKADLVEFTNNGVEIIENFA